ncbi:Serine/threonine-protein kinase CTR1 [Hordeum vulgare]|nr:Serine/threonine-protein kinase CTR1 [Hordeum vulgare]
MLPTGVFEDIEKWMHFFFWAGKDKVNDGQCLVAWSQVYRPTRFGGLGIKDLRLQALALRVRWDWLKQDDPNRPWQGLKLMDDDAASSVFNSLVKINVGNGARVLFWRDRWINGFTIKEIAPLIFQLVPTRARNSRTVQQVLTDNYWTQDVHGDLSFMAHIQVAHLCQAMASVPGSGDVPDQFAWPANKSGSYTAKSVYQRLCSGMIESPFASAVWRC